MLQTLFPQAHCRYTSLPLLGSIIAKFAAWLGERGYQKGTLRVMLPATPQIDRWLRHHGAQGVCDLDASILEECWTAIHRRGSSTGGVIRALAQYLEWTGVLKSPRIRPATPSERLQSRYEKHLREVRGFSESSIRNHVRTVSRFLSHVRYDAQPPCLPNLTPSDIESFVRQSGKRLTRTSLQQLVAHLRGFLRFQVSTGQGCAGLADTIDTPRIYRHEQLPHSLPWETVRALLESINRGTCVGLRDYTMLLLIAAYGLRVSEIASLTLDHIHWREGWLQVPRPKLRSPMRLPLTNIVASALVQYLRKARPEGVDSRHVFLRSRAPLAALRPTAVTMTFARWAKKCPLKIPFFGAHCLRHSYAVHLLHSGTHLKTIGDLLGHRHVESTGTYLRLATEDLREVALPLPGGIGPLDGEVTR